MIIGGREFLTDRHTYIMGILNVTPDSFSDGGEYVSLDDALRRTAEMIADGADLIDVGGMSSRPGYTEISQEEEIARIVPVIERIKREFDIPVSLDTYRADTACAGIEAGADLINDIWGLKKDPKMAQVIEKSKLPCCLMHNRENHVYDDLLTDIRKELYQSVKLAMDAGILREKIILDPGIGFGKTYIQNLRTIHSLQEFKKMGYPLLLGTSRKSVIQNTLDALPKDCIGGTLATTVIGVMKGCTFLRVHDVKENKQAVQMTEAILQCG